MNGMKNPEKINDKILANSSYPERLHCSPFHLHLLDALMHCQAKLFHCAIMVIFFGVPFCYGRLR